MLSHFPSSIRPKYPLNASKSNSRVWITDVRSNLFNCGILQSTILLTMGHQNIKSQVMENRQGMKAPKTLSICRLPQDFLIIPLPRREALLWTTLHRQQALQRINQPQEVTRSPITRACNQKMRGWIESWWNCPINPELHKELPKLGNLYLKEIKTFPV